MSAYIKKPTGEKTNATVKYFVSTTPTGAAEAIPGIEVKDTGMVHIKYNFTIPDDPGSKTIYVFAESLNGDVRTPDSERIKIEIKKKSAITGVAPVDYPARPKATTPPAVASNGTWKLHYSDEFDTPADGTSGTNRGLSAGWAPYYLRSWSTDAESAAYFELENDMLYLTGHRDMRPWSEQDNTQRISGIMSMQRPFLHRWGNSPTKSREIPVFDGIATKFGYFELRAKLPNTRDGAHFAWWMVGAQDDQHPSVTSAANHPLFVNPNDSNAYGWSNHGAEYDLLEQHMNPVYAPSAYYAWSRHHINNGTNAMTGWSTGTSGNGYYNFRDNGKDPYNEFHTYGFEWDENGFKYYLDDDLVTSQPTAAGANYRMLQIFSLYLGKSNRSLGTFGTDRGIYPKDVVVDYFRIYKQDTAPSPHSIQITMSPYYFQVPGSGSKTFQMQAKVLDQFDQEMPAEAANIKWKLSKSVAGPQRYLFSPDWSTPSLNGVGITDTGVVTINSNAGLGQDVYITAYHSGALNQSQFRLQRGVFETRHIKLSKDAAKARVVYFEGWPTHKAQVTPGGTVIIKPIVYDQYLNAMSTQPTVTIQKDITAREEIAIPGVTLSGQTLSVAGSVPVGTAIIINAKTRAQVPFEGPLAVGGKSPVKEGGLTEYVMGNLVVEVKAP